MYMETFGVEEAEGGCLGRGGVRGGCPPRGVRPKAATGIRPTIFFSKILIGINTKNNNQKHTTKLSGLCLGGGWGKD